MTDGNHTNGNTPLLEERAPIPAWLLTDDDDLERELAIRTARLGGLDVDRN